MTAASYVPVDGSIQMASWGTDLAARPGSNGYGRGLLLRVPRSRRGDQPRTQPVEAVGGDRRHRHAERRHDRRVADTEHGTTEANAGKDCRAQADGDGHGAVTQAD